MKLRLGFVSNSSSSSFVCDVYGDVQAGYDMSLSEAEMCECVKGHTFCECHISDNLKIVEEEIYYGDFRYNYPEEFCPVCKELKEEQEQRIKNSEDPDWDIYIKLYNKFNGLKP